MILETVTDIKAFMSALLAGNTFDRFLAADITITTYNTFHIDGHIKKAFYTAEEYENLGSPEISSWQKLRPICYDLIKGKKTPLSFKFVFCLSREDTSAFLAEYGISFPVEQIQGLFVNIKYEDGILSYVTGTSLKIFSLDKTLEQSFDSYISKLLAL